jgi:FlaA1/EpsC-like NDP-sugar epimerase
VAERLIADSKRSIKIVYTGLRPGEKMHEDLFGEGEVDLRPVHPHISHVRVPPISSVWAEQFLAPLAGTGLKRQLRELCRRFDAIASAVQSRAAGA